MMATHMMSKWSTTTEEQQMKKLKNIHPGEILKEESLDPLEISA